MEVLSSFVLSLLWKNRAIDQSTPICPVSRSGNSFIPSGKIYLLPLSLDRPLLLLPSGARLRQCEGSVGGPYMPYTAPPPSPNLFTDGASLSSSPHFFVDNTHGPIYPYHPPQVLVEECVQLRLILLGHSPSLASVEQHCYGVGLEYPDLGVLTQFATSPDLTSVLNTAAAFAKRLQPVPGSW